jgi:hypothetical protein
VSLLAQSPDYISYSTASSMHDASPQPSLRDSNSSNSGIHENGFRTVNYEV